MRTVGALAIAFFCIDFAVAQKVIEPEACILDTLKGAAAQQAAAMVRFNCVRQYIRAVEGKAVAAPISYFTTSKLMWYPAIAGLPTGIAERIVVNLKNDSELRIIYADIVLSNNKTKNQDVVRAYALRPIDPRTVGRLEADTNTGAKDFASEWSWGFEAVYGVPR
jgi:hypothetical protein